MKEKIIDILSEIIPDVNFETAENIINNGIIDSLDLVVLVGDLNSTFNVDIKAQHLTPENFNSAEAIAKLVKNLKNAD